MIHDMKTPLSSILACTSFLHSGKMESMQLKERYFCIIEDETGHLLNLTNKVLTLSKLENHKLEMSRTVFPLEPMIDDLIEKFSLSVPSHCISLRIFRRRKFALMKNI